LLYVRHCQHAKTTLFPTRRSSDLLVALDVPLVAERKFLRDIGSAFVVAEENDFDIGMKGLPGLDGVALDDADVSAEGLHCGEKRSEEHTSELQSRGHLVCRLLLEK